MVPEIVKIARQYSKVFDISSYT
ncbi:unnamed protein product [Acanthoscelides obtectus]|uniref:Uncharacterized protein n=1 Tax=Acanthoscelides obtectus TaxID=200917 RepID=A0A9P0MK67_ACAOB|nr:unnamed protein product [Acanthoscelides obtectus]CAK1622509.1 hypothetical protein AOBTE_LOCUS1527 [Acanthoscelides obtectus]